MIETFTEIWQTARRNKLRTSLTGFAVAWGIFMLVVLLGAGNGLINAQMQNNDRYVDNSMMIFGGMTSKPYDGLKEGRDIRLDNNDLATTQSRFVQNVDKAGAVLYEGGATITVGENYVSSSLRGVYPMDQEINKKEIVAGRFINDIDIRDQRKVLILPENQARELVPHNPRSLVGKNVKVGDLAFTVIGIEKEDKSRMSTEVTVPFTTLQTIYNYGNRVGRINFTFHGLTTEKENEAFEERYRATINRQHQAAPDDEDAIWIWNRFTQAMQMAKGLNIIRTALWVIGLFTLLSGIVGVSNIMLITVRERTREFGIRKAIGASPLSILRIIITESIVVTGFFGYIGMLLGVCANLYMDATLGSKPIETGLFTTTVFVDPTVSLGTCVGVTLVLVVAGTIAGLMPALKAAKIRPIEALRAE
ncbi:MAG: ABC transporter permease [Bacteroidaceae bacterium]|nr:ABC transporter permease [Bacteroidaceae bacterium]MBR0243548.1 ABC transporter permease [Bacteroidaceae bacterium]